MRFSLVAWLSLTAGLSASSLPAFARVVVRAEAASPPEKLGGCYCGAGAGGLSGLALALWSVARWVRR